MSAQIPSTMKLKDLLKPTGYDCPKDLLDATFEEAISGGDSKISTNTEKTIDVSAYTEPVVIEPAEGYDATKKVTLTLDNIPSGADLESNHAETIDVSQYTEPVEIEPTAGKDGMEKVTITLSNIPSPHGTLYAWKHDTDIVYTKVATPTTSDKALVGASTGLSEAVIASVGEGSITIGEDAYEAYAVGNVEV